MDEKINNGVYGGVEFTDTTRIGDVDGTIGTPGTEVPGGDAGTINKAGLPTKVGFWSKFKAFWLQEIDLNAPIKVELTPYQQKVEDEINEFLHQEITWEKIHNFLFQEVTFGKKK